MKASVTRRDTVPLEVKTLHAKKTKNKKKHLDLMRIFVAMHHLYSPNTKVIQELYDGNNSVSAVTVTVTVAREALAKKKKKDALTLRALQVFK